MKNNNKNIPAKGMVSFITYLSDRGGVGYIRTILPSIVLGAKRHKQMTFEPIYMSNFVPLPQGYKNFSFAKFQRSATKEQLGMFEYFKNNISKQTNTPMIYEIDDMLIHHKGGFIPEGNFASEYYKNNESYVIEMLKMVDGITVSTPYLKKVFSKFNNNISVVPNRIAKCVGGDVKKCNPETKNKRPKIIYPGSQNHFGIQNRTEEGGDFGKTLLNYIKKTKKQYEWVFIGGIPEELKNDNDITYYQGIDYMNYPIFMKSIEADLAIAPLEINEFNKCKSKLKALEYTVCGMPAVYTDIEPYEKCSCKVKTEEEMISKIETLTKNPDKRYNIGKSDYEKIKKDIFLEDNYLKWINEHLKLFKMKIQ